MSDFNRELHHEDHHEEIETRKARIATLEVALRLMAHAPTPTDPYIQALQALARRTLGEER